MNLHFSKAILFAAALLSTVSWAAPEEKGKITSCPALIQDGKCAEARKHGEQWLSSKDPKIQAEGHKCLANVALCGGGGVTIQPGDTGGGYMGEGYAPQEIDDALAHLNQALKLVPQDLSVHKGRLYVLMLGARFDEMTPTLEDSLRTYQGGTADEWIGYSSDLFERQQYRSGIEILKVLDKKFPSDHQVVGNLGAMHIMLHEDEKAIEYLKRAVELSPKDPIDTWNLARAYEFTGNNDLAEKWYTQAFKVEDDEERKKENSCLYADFVQKKLKEAKRACDIQRANKCKQAACGQN